MAGAVINDITKAVVRRRSAGASGAPVSDVVRRRGGDTGFTGILDQLSVAPILALSTRRLTSDFTGDIATIREDGLNAEDSFSYTGSPPTLDFDAINTFIGVNDGWWKGWQNQVTGNSAAQTVQASQPLYVTGEGPDFTQGPSLVVPHAAALNGTGGLTIVARLRVDGFGGGPGGLGRIVDKSSSAYLFFVNGVSDDLKWISAGGTQISSSSLSLLSAGDVNIAVTCTAAGAVVLYRNNSQVGSGNSGALSGVTATSDLIIGNNAAGDRGFNGPFESLFVFPGVLGSSDLAALNTWLG